MKERDSHVNDVLIAYTPRVVNQAFDLDPELVKVFGFVTNADHDAIINELFNKKPSGDIDKNGWLFLLGSSFLGYKVQQRLLEGKEIFKDDFIRAVQSQLADDAPRWGVTWKKRSIDGQLDRTYQSTGDYTDKYVNGNEQFPWLKVAGGIIINLYRIDNPDYQK